MKDYVILMTLSPVDFAGAGKLKAIKNGDYEVLDFGDSNWVDNPPHTGKETKKLSIG